jgi:dTDP-glucose 4,6-dehydratase
MDPSVVHIWDAGYTAEKLARDADAVVNFAAESHVDRSISDSSAFLRSNVLGVHSLLEVVRKTGVRFHQISNDEVYGSLPLGSQEKFNKRSPYNPRNPYSATKAAADFLVRAYHNTYHLPVTISNCSNNFGPYQHPEKLYPQDCHIRPLREKGSDLRGRDAGQGLDIRGEPLLGGRPYPEEGRAGGDVPRERG